MDLLSLPTLGDLNDPARYGDALALGTAHREPLEGCATAYLRYPRERH